MSDRAASTAHRLARRAFARASRALACGRPAGLPDWLDRSVVRALGLPLPGHGEPVLDVALRDGVEAGWLPTHWHLPGSTERLPLRARPAAAARAQRAPSLSRSDTPLQEGSATALLQDRLGPQRYLLTCAHVAAGPSARAGDVVNVRGDAGGVAALSQWQPALGVQVRHTPIDAALLRVDTDLFDRLRTEGSLLPGNVGGAVVADQPLVLRRRGGPIGARALIYWSGFVDVPGLTPDEADYFLERGIGYRCVVPTHGGDSGAAVWDAGDGLVGMHLASLDGAPFDEPNAVFGAIQPVLDWFRVSPVLRGGQVARGAARDDAGPTRDRRPAASAAALGDREVVAATLWGEARNQDENGRRAVAGVIANRARTRYRRCASAREVCLDRWQFSCWNPGDPNLPKMLQVVARPDRDFAPALALADEVLANTLVDITRGARHYHAAGVRPAWARGHRPCAVFGDHLFYNDVA